jgi:hypothetical protein
MMRIGDPAAGMLSRVKTPRAIGFVVPSAGIEDVSVVDTVSVIVARHVVATPTRVGSHETVSDAEAMLNAGTREATIPTAARAPAVLRTIRPRTDGRRGIASPWKARVVYG